MHRKILLMIMVISLLLCTGCEVGSPADETAISDTEASVTEETINEFPLEYQSYPDADKFIVDDKQYTYMFRLYADPSYYKSENGINYVAMSLWSPYLFTLTNDEVMALQEGDELVVDRDVTLHITVPVEVDSEWEDISFPEDNTLRGPHGEHFYRPKGRVKINDDFYFIHPQVTEYSDGREELEGNCSSRDDWMLIKNVLNRTDDQAYCYPVEGLYWVRLSDECAVDLHEETLNESRTTRHADTITQLTIQDLQTLLMDRRNNEDFPFCAAAVNFEEGEAKVIQVMIDEDNWV